MILIVKPLFILPRLAAMLVLACTLAACGQRGPLYMPGNKPPKESLATKPKIPAQSMTPTPSIVPEPAKPDANASDKQ